MFGSGSLGMGVKFTLTDDASTTASKIRGAMTGLQQTVNSVTASITSSAQQISSGIISITATAALMLGPFIKGITMANKFEQALSAAYARGGADNLAQLDLLRQEAFKISEETKFGAQNVADTYIVLAQAGFKNLQILNQIRPVTLLAAAGDVTLAKAAEYAGNVMHQFNKRSEDFGHIADVLVGGANESAQSLENLNQALKYLGPTAKSLNMSLEETVAITQLEANAGMKGTLGARAFGSSLFNLTGASSKAAKAMKEIGIDPFAGPGRTFVGMAKLVKMLSSAYKDMTQESRLKSIAEIFGKDASQEISTLLMENIEIVKDGKKMYMSAGDALEYFTKKNFESAGLAQRTNDLMMDNAQGWVDRVKALFKTTMINIGETFQESIKMIGPWLIKILTNINKIIKSPFGQWMLKIGFIIGLVTTALVALSVIIAVIIPAIWSMVSAAAALMVQLAPIIGIVMAIGYAIYKTTAAMETFDAVTVNTAGNLERPLTAWEKMAGMMAGLAEIWKSWNGTTFTLSADLHDKLNASGVLDETLNIGTYLIRAKEFSSSFLEAFKSSEWSSLGDSLSDVADALKDILLQLGLGPASGSLEWWKELGKTLGEFFGSGLIGILKDVAAMIEHLFHGLSLMIATLKEFAHAYKTFLSSGYTKFDFDWDRVFNRAFNDGKPSKEGNHAKLTPSEETAKKFTLNSLSNPKDIGTDVANLKNMQQLVPGNLKSPATTLNINIQPADLNLDGKKFGELIFKKFQTEFERGHGGE